VLDLTRAAVEDDAVAHLQRCVNLRVLRLAHCRVSDRGCIPLSHLAKLLLLDLSHTDVTLDALRWLTVCLRETGATRGLLSLERLLVRSCVRFAPGADAKSMLARALLLPQLREFDSSGTSILPGHVLELARAVREQPGVQQSVVVGVRLDIERDRAATALPAATESASRWSLFDQQITNALLYYNPTSAADQRLPKNVVVADEHEEIMPLGGRSSNKEVIGDTNVFDFDDDDDAVDDGGEHVDDVEQIDAVERVERVEHVEHNDDMVDESNDEDVVSYVPLSAMTASTPASSYVSASVTPMDDVEAERHYDDDDDDDDDEDEDDEDDVVTPAGPPILPVVFKALHSKPSGGEDVVSLPRKRLSPPASRIDLSKHGVPDVIGESIRDVPLPKRMLVRKPLSQQLSRGLAIDATMLRTVMSRLHDCETVKGVPIGSIVHSLNELFPELLDPRALKMAERALKCTELAACASSACECAAPVCCECGAVAVQQVGSIRGNVQCVCVASERRAWTKVQDALEAMRAVAERVGANWRLARPPQPPPPPGLFVVAVPAVADLFAAATKQKLKHTVNPKWTAASTGADLSAEIAENTLRSAFRGRKSLHLCDIVDCVRKSSRKFRCDNLSAAVVRALERFKFVQIGGKWWLPEHWDGKKKEVFQVKKLSTTRSIRSKMK
jgi:hypothetical protein